MEARKLRVKIATACFAATAIASMAMPALASADPVSDLLNQLGLGGLSGQSGGLSGQSSTPPSTNGGSSDKAGAPPSYVPPLHGTNPHGQGEAATIDLTPSNTNPVSGTPGQPEEVVLGSSKGEQNPDGTYHGHINILSLFGSEVLSVNSTPGQSNASPVAALQTSILNPLCTGSGGALCVTLLQADSSTTSTGSTNTFKTAAATIGTGTNSISASAVTSDGNISSDGTCQTATGSSSIANANVLSAITAGAANSSSQSKACNNGTPSTVTQSGNVINLQGAGVPVPAAGCDNTPASGTPNTNFTALSPLLATVCNASDINGSQTSAPYGVREALTVFAVILNGVPTVKATTAGAESHAVAPLAAVTPPPVTPPNNNNNNNNGNGNGNNNNGGNGNPTPTANETGNPNGSLAFTGADLIWLAMLGAGLTGAGLAMYAAMSRSRRPRLQA